MRHKCDCWKHANQVCDICQRDAAVKRSVEKAAIAIYEEHFVMYSSSPDPWKGADERAKRKCRKTAKRIVDELFREEGEKK